MWTFGDGFDLYTAQSDASNYWDNTTGGGGGWVAGRFSGSQAFSASSTAVYFVKSSGSNDGIHHFNVAFYPGNTGNNTNYLYFQLLDGTTGQVTIVFHSLGSILLLSSNLAGATLATYPNAFQITNFNWITFEFEVVIHNTAGSFTVRKNGNPSNDFTATSLNTRGGTANNYANKLQIGSAQLANTQVIDDFLWRSDASSVPWLGDIRCITRMPVSDSSVQFSKSPAAPTTVYLPNSTASDPTGTARYTPFTPTVSGTVGSILVNVNTGFTGNMKCTMFADSGGSPAAVLGSATNVVNPVAGNNTFTFGSPVAVVAGTQYWFGISHDVTAVLAVGNTNIGRTGTAVAYASFPTASPVTSGGAQFGVSSQVNMTATLNYEFVDEAQQDSNTTGLYDSTVNHVDLYGVAAITPTPLSTIAVTTRAFVQQTDTGSRTASVQLKSGATTVASSAVTLTPSPFQWAWRTDTVDPNTSAAWVAANVAAITIGPKVVS